MVTAFAILAMFSFNNKEDLSKRSQASDLKTYPCLVTALHAKALYYQETLCRKEDIQKFLSTLVTKRPEVGEAGPDPASWATLIANS